MTPSRRIRFKFDLDKFVHLVTYLAEKVRDFDRLKATKMLYFIDKHHLIRYGRPILGDVYYRLDYGPVPSLAFDLLKEADDNLPVSLDSLPGKKYLLEYVEIDTRPQYPVFRPKKQADLEFFSEEEMASINAIIQRLGQLTSVQLMDKSHLDATHQRTAQRSQIDYRLFFEGEPEALHDAYEVMELEQEDREFAEGLADDRNPF